MQVIRGEKVNEYGWKLPDFHFLTFIHIIGKEDADGRSPSFWD